MDEICKAIQEGLEERKTLKDNPEKAKASEEEAGNSAKVSEKEVTEAARAGYRDVVVHEGVHGRTVSRSGRLVHERTGCLAVSVVPRRTRESVTSCMVEYEPPSRPRDFGVD